MNLKELSLQLGLSQTTVSRALNGYPEVSEGTRLRVQQAARDHNYRPSMRAKSLATGKAMAIGHVIPMADNLVMVNPVFGDFIAGAGEVYGRNGYEMALTVLDRDQDESLFYRDYHARNAVDGIVLHNPQIDDPRIAMLRDLGLPFVVHGRSSNCTLPYAWVDVNNRRAFQQGTQHLLDLGHRKIALINGDEGLDYAYRRRLGFLDSMTAAGLPPEAAMMRHDEMTEKLGFIATLDFLDQPDPPTAIICASILVAIGCRRAIESRGLRMGGDISVVTHDDDLSYLSNGTDDPIFSAVQSSVRDAGRIAAKLLLDTIANPGQEPKNHVMDAAFIVGSSTGPAPS